MITVDIKSRIPIYEQLYENTRKLILEGVLEEDQKLPSVRELASMLTINPNTIQKAYRRLEQEGYLYVVRGKGNFVKKLDEDLLNQQEAAIQKRLCQLIKEAQVLGLDRSRVLQMVEVCMEETR